MTPSNATGLFEIAAGVYFLLMATGKVPRNPKNPEATAAWRQKFGPMMMVASPIILVHGALRVFGILA